MSEMIDWDSELESICRRAGLSIDSSQDDCDCFIDTFRRVWDGIPDSTPIAFFGRGRAFASICKAIDVRSKNVVCVIENHKLTTADDIIIPVTNIANINDYCFSKVIILSHSYRENMKEELRAHKGEVEIIDVYDILARKGKFYDKPFFKTVRKDYYDLERLRDAYINSKDTDRAGDSLKSLISAYLECRDFLSANIYIEEYVQQGFESGESFRELQHELKAFLNRIGSTIRNKQNKNIIVFIADAMSYDMAKKTPFLEHFGKSGMVFSNAYSAGFFTKAAIFSILTGKLHVRDGNFRLDGITPSESVFLAKACEHGFKVKYFAPSYLNARLSIRKESNFKTELITTLLWALYKEMANQDGDCVYFIHSIQETHMPYACGNADEKLIDVFVLPNVINDVKPFLDYELTNRVIRLKNSSLRYWNDQTAFAINLIERVSDDIIITSDHGEPVSLWEKMGINVNADMEKITMIIRSKHAARGEYAKLFSNPEMSSILVKLMQNEKLVFDALPYVRTEIEPAYNRNLTLQKNMHRNIYFGQTRLISEDDVYIFCYNGDEGYYIKPDLETNLIADDAHKERIAYYRSQLNLDTREIWKAMFNKYPVLKKIHEANSDVFLRKNLCPC